MEKREQERPCAVITGGSRGIGRAAAVKLSETMNIVVNYERNAEAAAETVRLCREHGAQALAVQADVSREEDVKRLFAAAAEAFGPAEVLVNNAGITRDNLILRMTEADFEQVVDVNLKSTFLCCREASKSMLRQHRGRIICMSSFSGVHGNAGQVNYAASKAGVIGLVKSLARELAARNITVNAIAPGFIDTDMTGAMKPEILTEMIRNVPLGRIGKPEDIASAAAFLASEGASYITGQVICVDGGLGI